MTTDDNPPDGDQPASPRELSRAHPYMGATDQFPEELRGKQRIRCYQQVRLQPCTPDECRRALGEIIASTVAARFSELAYDGWIVETGVMRRTAQGGLAWEMRATTEPERKEIWLARPTRARLRQRARKSPPTLEGSAVEIPD